MTDINTKEAINVDKIALGVAVKGTTGDFVHSYSTSATSHKAEIPSTAITGLLEDALGVQTIWSGYAKVATDGIIVKPDFPIDGTADVQLQFVIEKSILVNGLLGSTKRLAVAQSKGAASGYYSVKENLPFTIKQDDIKSHATVSFSLDGVGENLNGGTNQKAPTVQVSCNADGTLGLTAKPGYVLDSTNVGNQNGAYYTPCLQQIRLVVNSTALSASVNDTIEKVKSDLTALTNTTDSQNTDLISKYNDLAGKLDDLKQKLTGDTTDADGTEKVTLDSLNTDFQDYKKRFDDLNKQLKTAFVPTYTAIDGQVNVPAGKSFISIYDGKGNGKRDRVLKGGTSWVTDLEMDVNGNDYYRVSTDDWVLGNDIGSIQLNNDAKVTTQLFSNAGTVRVNFITVCSEALRSDNLGFNQTTNIYYQGTPWYYTATAVYKGHTWYRINTNQWLVDDNVTVVNKAN